MRYRAFRLARRVSRHGPPAALCLLHFACLCPGVPPLCFVPVLPAAVSHAFIGPRYYAPRPTASLHTGCRGPTPACTRHSFERLLATLVLLRQTTHASSR